ncbi:hypothetical protein ACM66B_002220 [Microbotryomycetes sp. NB124-2]
MNERQRDELLALSAIYPDQVEWQTIDTGADSDKHVVDVSIKVEIDWDNARLLDVWDWLVEALADQAVAKEQQPEAQLDGLAGKVQQVDLRNTKNDDVCVSGPHSGSAAPVANGSSHNRNRRQHKTRPKNSDASSTSSQAAQRNHAPRSQPASLPALSPPSKPPFAEKQCSPPVAKFDTGRLKFQPAPVSHQSQNLKAAPPKAANPTKLQQPKSLSLRYLPPLRIQCRLSQEYPGDAVPLSVTVQDDVGWLGRERRRQLEDTLRLACTQDECLLLLVDLVTGPALIDTLGLSFPLELRQDEPEDATSYTALSDVLSAHNDTVTRLTFSSATFDCALCLSSLKGASCVSLKQCGHVACLPCLKSYFGLCITEGLVRSVACPDPSCTKAKAEYDKLGEQERAGRDEPGVVSVDELRIIVGQDMVERYLWLKEKQRVESDPSVAFCPRESCRAAVPRPNTADFDDGDKLRVCPQCSHSFCVVCLKTWHGSRNACSLPASSSIVSRYLEGDDQERSALELRYGRANIKRLVTAFEEERANSEWRQQHSTQCPGCQIWVERSQGCAHMQCARCGTHFCFKCAKSLSPTDPYKHYSTPGLPCYNKLFDFTVGQEPRVEEWIGDVLQDDVERQLNVEAFHPQGWNPFV